MKSKLVPTIIVIASVIQLSFSNFDLNYDPTSLLCVSIHYHFCFITITK